MTAECRFCGREAPLYFRARDFNRRVTGQTFEYYRCRGCGVIFLWPVPADLGKFYPPDYYHDDAFPTPAQLDAAAEVERYKIELVKRFAPRGGRLLEIGPGGGGFAHLAKQCGFDTGVIEMDERASRFLREVVGVEVVNSDDAKAALVAASKCYDVIALWHVIEHLTDPWGTMEAAAARLLPGGILVVAAPNPAAFQFQVLGRRWVHVDAPRHVLLIPVETLIARGGRLDLKPVMVTTTDEGAVGWNKFGWEESLFNLTTYWRPRHLLRKVGTGLNSLFAPIERGGMRGSAYTVIFQKGDGNSSLKGRTT